jgi:osmotically-inducible protein OsmY
MTWLLPAIVWTGCSFSGTSALNNSPSDGAISSEVEGKLASDQFGGLSGVSVTTEAGVVMLVGTVERAEQKARAADLARQVKGVKRVKNELDIRRSRPEQETAPQ